MLQLTTKMYFDCAIDNAMVDCLLLAQEMRLSPFNGQLSLVLFLSILYQPYSASQNPTSLQLIIGFLIQQARLVVTFFKSKVFLESS